MRRIYQCECCHYIATAEYEFVIRVQKAEGSNFTCNRMLLYVKLFTDVMCLYVLSFIQLISSLMCPDRCQQFVAIGLPAL